MAEEPPFRDTWFSPFTLPGTDAIKALAAQTKDSLEQLERDLGERTRARKPSDEATFKASVDTIVANLVMAVYAPPESGWIAIGLSHREVASRKRYLNPLLPPKTMRKSLELMETAGILESVKGGMGRSTIFRPTSFFATEVEAYGLSLEDITYDWKNEEVIILSERKRDDLFEGPRGELKAELVDYSEDGDTPAMREQVRAALSYVARLDLVFDDDGEAPRVYAHRRSFKRRFSLLPGASLSSPQAPHSSSHSNPQPSNWTHGGRLFGDAFWLGLRRDRRRNSLRINGEPITEVDLQAFFLRASYVILGERLPEGFEGDPYAIHGYPEGGSRGALKAAFASFLYHDGILKRLPNKIAEKMPEGWTARKTREAILKAHPKLEPLFGTRVGFRLLRLESDILLATMAALDRAGLSGLPLHDGVICPRSEGMVVRDIMAREALRIAGPGLVVDLKD